MENNDTQRLTWLIGEILTSEISSVILDQIGITQEDLTGPGDVTFGDLFRAAIDKKI